MVREDHRRFFAAREVAVAPLGPLMVLSFARLIGPRLAIRICGPGRAAVLGCFVNVCALAWRLTQIQTQPAYFSHMLPIQLLGGAGVGLTTPSLIGAGSASIPPARFGTGSGVLNVARQIGTVFGVAGLNATNPVATFRHGMLSIILFFALVGVVSGVL